MRTYTAEERAAAVGLAMSIGPMRAAQQLGYPVRTVTAWRSGERHGDDITPIVAASRQELARRLWEGVTAGVDAVLEGLHDPRQRLADRARALEVVMNAHQLLTGGSTSNVSAISVNIDPNIDPESGLSWEERDQLRDWLEAQRREHPELFPQTGDTDG
jgi:hypothetical protein